MERETTLNPTMQPNKHAPSDRFIATSNEQNLGGRPLATQAPEITAEGVAPPHGSAPEAGEGRETDMASRAAEGAREVAGEMRERLDEAKAQAQIVGHRIAEGADAAMTATGTRMTGVADSLRARADETSAGRIAARTGDALSRGGEYLQQSSPADVRTDLENVMRERPMTTLLVGAGVGYLLARALRRS